MLNLVKRNLRELFLNCIYQLGLKTEEHVFKSTLLFPSFMDFGFGILQPSQCFNTKNPDCTSNEFLYCLNMHELSSFKPFSYSNAVETLINIMSLVLREQLLQSPELSTSRHFLKHTEHAFMNSNKLQKLVFS